MPGPIAEWLGLTRWSDHYEARLGLLLDERVDKVWLALTTPDWLPRWLAPGRIEPKLGGDVAFEFGDSACPMRSTVTALIPGSLIEYAWSRAGERPRPVRWALEPLGPTTRLTLTVAFGASTDVARFMAGWAAHLDMLVAALAGIPIEFPFDVFQGALAAYRAELGAAGAGTH